MQPDQDGWCGNFNCDAEDDYVPKLKERGVAQGIQGPDSLFASAPADVPHQTVKPDHCPKTLNDCPAAVVAQAKTKCAGEPAGTKDGCELDFCLADHSHNDQQNGAKFEITSG